MIYTASIFVSVCFSYFAFFNVLGIDVSNIHEIIHLLLDLKQFEHPSHVKSAYTSDHPETLGWLISKGSKLTTQFVTGSMISVINFEPVK